MKNLEKLNELMSLLFEYQEAGHGDVHFSINGHVFRFSYSIMIGEWDKDKDYLIQKFVVRYKDIQVEINRVEEIIANIDKIKADQELSKNAEIERKIAELKKQLK